MCLSQTTAGSGKWRCVTLELVRGGFCHTSVLRASTAVPGSHAQETQRPLGGGRSVSGGLQKISGRPYPLCKELHRSRLPLCRVAAPVRQRDPLHPALCFCLSVQIPFSSLIAFVS